MALFIISLYLYQYIYIIFKAPNLPKSSSWKTLSSSAIWSVLWSSFNMQSDDGCNKENPRSPSLPFLRLLFKNFLRTEGLFHRWLRSAMTVCRLVWTTSWGSQEGFSNHITRTFKYIVQYSYKVHFVHASGDIIQHRMEKVESQSLNHN